MVKYFSHPRSEKFVNCAFPNRTEEKINRYADENNLEVVSVSCFEDDGIFVVFKSRSVENETI